MSRPSVPEVSLRAVPTEEARLIVRGLRPGTGPTWHPEYPTEDTLTGFRLLIEAHAWSSGPETSRWWIHQIVVEAVPAVPMVVGDIGFHGPPAPEPPHAVEIGYQVVPSWQRRGVATEACAQLVAMAWRDGAEEVWAETDPTNRASRTVLARNGFLVQLDGRLRLRRPPR